MAKNKKMLKTHGAENFDANRSSDVMMVLVTKNDLLVKGLKFLPARSLGTK